MSMSLIEEFVPAPRLREVDHVAVAASPDEAWRAVRAVDLHDHTFARWLFALRSSSLLVEESGRELVIGSIGRFARFWQPEIEWCPLSSDEFAGFDEPGLGKLAWNLEVAPRSGGGSWITCDLRVTATDEASWRRFRRYWLVIGRVSRVIRRALLRRLAAALGAAPEPRGLPGDAILPEAQFVREHRRVLDAPIAALWPRLARNRDSIAARPDGDAGFVVLELEPRRALVIGSPSLVPGAYVPIGTPPGRMTWAIVLEPVGDTATELTVRVRATGEPNLKNTAASLVIGLEHELMERRTC